MVPVTPGIVAVTFDTNRVATIYEGDTSSAVSQLGQSGSFVYGLAPNASSLIIGGTSTALVLLVGFLALQEPVTWVRVLAIALIAAGILLFQAEGA